MDVTVAQNSFELAATQDRVWDLLGRAIFGSLKGMEKLKIVDDNSFKAELKTKAYGIPMTMYLLGNITDMNPPESITVILNAHSKPNFVSVQQKVVITSKPAGDGKVQVSSVALVQKMTPLFKPILIGQVKKQAQDILDAIEARLKQVA
jgi:hypothetical protein